MVAGFDVGDLRLCHFLEFVGFVVSLKRVERSRRILLQYTLEDQQCNGAHAPDLASIIYIYIYTYINLNILNFKHI